MLQNNFCEFLGLRGCKHCFLPRALQLFKQCRYSGVHLAIKHALNVVVFAVVFNRLFRHLIVQPTKL